MGRGRSWSAEERDFLENNWGRYTIPQLAKKLNRSNNAVKTKIARYGLGKAVDNANCLTARQTSEIMGVDVHAITDYWIPKLGLRCRKIAPQGERKQTWISMTDLLKWLKNNQDAWDSRRVEQFILGSEPNWLKEKRQKDKLLPERRFQKWTPEEDRMLLSMYKSGIYTVKEIGTALNRSQSAAKHRISRLDVWGTGKYIGDERLKFK